MRSEIDRKISKLIWKIRLLFWIPEFTVYKDLEMVAGDNGDICALLLRRVDIVGLSSKDIRNGLFGFVNGIPPEVAINILSSGRNDKRALASKIALRLRKKGLWFGDDKGRS